MGATDPAFRDDVSRLIWDGYFRIPWFNRFQRFFNFWIGFESDANATLRTGDNPRGLCAREVPEGFEERYSWVDSAAIVHTSACRDNAGSPGAFTIEASEDQSAQVIAHETGHRPFGLGDEYCCDGGYGTSSKGLGTKWKPPFPNIFKKESQCQDDSVGRAYDAANCRLQVSADDKERWFTEPAYSLGYPDGWETDGSFDPNNLVLRDLMQQTGRRCRWQEIIDDDGNPTGDFRWFCITMYNVGDSERDRMSWLLSRCANGEC